MKRLAIITARGGSKRIPYKNIREFCGKPIITYSIEAALQSGVFDEVMVSTDDEKIAAIAKEAGAKVEFVGHPLVDIVKPSMTINEANGFAGKKEGRKLILLMPGSRLMEIEKMLPLFVIFLH